jgi:hypothetical protein
MIILSRLKIGFKSLKSNSLPSFLAFTTFLVLLCIFISDAIVRSRRPWLVYKLFSMIIRGWLIEISHSTFSTHHAILLPSPFHENNDEILAFSLLCTELQQLPTVCGMHQLH